MAARCIIAYVNAKVRRGLGCCLLGRAYINVQRFELGGKTIEIRCENSYVDEALAAAIALSGLYFQFSMGFSPPFPLNIVLLPLSFAEACLVWLAGDLTRRACDGFCAFLIPSRDLQAAQLNSI
jgi:hypothetical protein